LKGGHQKDAYMKQLMALTDEVHFAGQPALWNVQSKTKGTKKE
jgi:hypothetical protein